MRSHVDNFPYFPPMGLMSIEAGRTCRRLIEEIGPQKEKYGVSVLKEGGSFNVGGLVVQIVADGRCSPEWAKNIPQYFEGFDVSVEIVRQLPMS